MIGVAGGLLAALLWGTSTTASTHASRRIGAEISLAWVYVVGLLVALPVAVSTGLPHADGRGLAWTAVSASAGISSLYLLYAALRRGPVVLVAPISASQGAAAAVLAVLLGERLHILAGVGLGVLVLGLFAVMRRPGGPAGRPAHPTAAIVLASLSAALAALALYGSARAADSLGTPWLLAVFRIAGVAALMTPLVVSGRLRRPGPVTRLVVFCGLADTAALASYIVGATHGSSVAVPAILASQYAAVAVLIGVLTMGERLTRGQLAGVVAILGGVALVTAAQS